jgi:competence protein ComEC
MIPLLFPLLALIAGVAASPYLEPKAVWLCLPLALLVGIARKHWALLFLFLLGAGLGSMEPAVPSLPGETEANRVVGTMLRRPDWRGLGVYLDVEISAIDDTPYQGRARLTEFLDDPATDALFRSLDLATGDRIEIVVRLRRPSTYRDPGVFDFRRFLERQGIYWTGTIRNPRLITVLHRGSWISRSTDRLREGIEGRISSHFEKDRPARGLVLGMTLGRRQDLTYDVERDFQAGGLYHIVVVSGFNLAVIASAAGLLARFVFRKRTIRLLVIVAAALAYSVLVGAQAPVIRAAVMVCILVVGRLLDRDYSPLNAISLTAMLLLIHDPTALEDASFQMTFAATAAIAGIGVPCNNWLLQGLRQKLHDFDNMDLDGYLPPEVADWRVARRMFCERQGLPHVLITIPWRLYRIALEALVLSLAVEMVFVVFMVTSFHRLSPISPLLNIPAGIIASIVTTLGLLLVVAPPVVSGLVAWMIQSFVHLLLLLLDAALAVPFASLRVPSPPAWIWLAYGALAGAVVFAIYRRQWATCLLAYTAILVTQGVIVEGDFSPPPPKAVTVTFLDVGQGDSVLIEFPTGRRVLIDGGGVAAGRFLALEDRSTFSVGEDVVSAYLFARGIRRLDTVVLTHAHNDHMDGLFDVLSNFDVRELWLGRNPMIPAYRALIELAGSRGIPLRFITAGEQLGDFTVLHPPRQWRLRNTAQNNDSVVLLLRSGNRTALFTGDMELPLPGVERVSLLKVAHHGSRGVRMKVRSDVRVISVGASNPFGHPHPSALPALRTDLFGAIQVELRGERPVVSLP